MNSLKFVLLLCICLFLLSCSPAPEAESVSEDETALEHAARHLQAKYICPMHSNIVRDAPASCPVCGMDLVRQSTSPDEDAAHVVELGAAVVQKLGVRSVTVANEKLWKYIKTTGNVAYDEQLVATVRAKVDGWVENLGVRRSGLVVNKGQLLMELYSPVFLKVQAAFIDSQNIDKSGNLNKYSQRQESVDSRDALRYMGISESLINDVARTGKPYHRIPIYTPKHGTVIRHNVHKHQYVQEGENLFTIADLSSVWVEADIYEHQLNWVKRHQTAEVSVQALPGKKWTGRVIYIYPELNSRAHTLRVRIRVPNYDGDLKPNMLAQVEIFSGPTEKVLIVPRDALIVTGDRESVVLDKGDGHFQPVDVVSGIRSNGRVEIVSGLKEGDRVVVSGQFLIDSEASLQASFSRMTEQGE